MSRGVIPAPEQRETKAHEADQRACPLCEFNSEKQTDIYVHLQTAHRKSALATALLDSTSES